MAISAKGLLASSGLLFLFCEMHAQAKIPPLRLRTDLQKKTQLFCTTQRDVQSLWQAGVYDTLLSLRTLLHTKQAEQLARTQAQREDSAGYAYGSCKDGRGWVLSVSAPHAAMVKGHRVKLAAGLQHYCRGLQARYAPSSWQRTQVLAIKQHELSLPRQGNGLVAVRCLSQQPHKTGPRLLYVFPVGKPAMQAPLLPQQVRRGQEQQAVQAWVTAVRAKMGLAALPLQRAPRMKERFSVIHDRVQLRAVKQALHQQRRRLLGENRARGHTLNEALTMLWVSPFHRDLLLHDKAAYLMIDIVRQKNQVLVKMLISSALSKLTHQHNDSRKTAKR